MVPGVDGVGAGDNKGIARERLGRRRGNEHRELLVLDGTGQGDRSVIVKCKSPLSGEQALLV